MSSIVIKGNTSGQVEIAAPDVAGSTTLTLPTGTANLLTADGDGSQLTNLPQPAALTTATGSAPSYSLRAWVNTDDNGSIRNSGNVSSVTDNATGDFTVNFTTALPSNYAWSVGSNISLAQYTGYPVLKTSSSVPTLYTTSAFRFHTVESSTGGVRDVTYICLMFIG